MSEKKPPEDQGAGIYVKKKKKKLKIRETSERLELKGLEPKS